MTHHVTAEPRTWIRYLVSGSALACRPLRLPVIALPRPRFRGSRAGIADRSHAPRPRGARLERLRETESLYARPLPAPWRRSVEGAQHRVAGSTAPGLGQVASAWRSGWMTAKRSRAAQPEVPHRRLARPARTTPRRGATAPSRIQGDAADSRPPVRPACSVQFQTRTSIPGGSCSAAQVRRPGYQRGSAESGATRRMRCLSSGALLARFPTESISSSGLNRH